MGVYLFQGQIVFRNCKGVLKMKKLLALLLALCMVFAFAACGESESEKALDDVQDAIENGDSDDIADAYDKLTDAASKEGLSTDQTVEEIVKEMKENGDFDEMIKSFEGQPMTLDIEARGNDLAYVVKYTIDVGDTATIKAALEEAGGEAFEALAASFHQIIPKMDKFICEYYDMNGNLITSFKY